MLDNFRVYQLAVRFYDVCEQIKCPRHFREGNGRPTLRDRRRFFYIAMSSLRESQTILHLLRAPKNSEAWQLADQIGAQLYRLIQNMKVTQDKDPSQSDPGL